VLRHERKGITKEVTLAGKPLRGWDIYSLPMTDTTKLPFGQVNCAGACFYRGEFHIDEPGDTFLDTSAFAKGFVWLNGGPLGRIWDIGPQGALFAPGPWLRAGENEVIVLDLEGHPGGKLAGLNQPNLTKSQN